MKKNTKNIKNDKKIKIEKLNKSNNIKKFFIISATCLSILLIIFFITASVLQANGCEEMNFFVFALIDGEGKLFGNIDSITILGWLIASISLVTIAFDITALVLGILFRSSKSILKEIKEVYTLK